MTVPENQQPDHDAIIIVVAITIPLTVLLVRHGTNTTKTLSHAELGRLALQKLKGSHLVYTTMCYAFQPLPIWDLIGGSDSMDRTVAISYQA
jgi:hypothetical protein